MKICYFGDYDPEYSRTRVLIKGLRENGIEIKECNDRSRGIKRYLVLIGKIKTLLPFDVLLVGYSNSRLMVLWARILWRGPLLWDALYSLYDSWVFDRKRVMPGRPRAFYYWFLDWLGCRLANKVLLDTQAHIDYFVRTFKVRENKFIKVLVGTDDKIFYPRKSAINDFFWVHFHGSFVPLQGVSYIVEAARLLEKEKVFFQIVGHGQEYQRIREVANEFNIKNISWIDWVKYEDLPGLMARADVCLGVFGNTNKTLRVIPNKVYEAIAMKKPVISADTLAVRELFENEQNILFCKTAAPGDLAGKILKLKKNKDLLDKISKGGYEVFIKHALPVQIAKGLLVKLNKSL